MSVITIDDGQLVTKDPNDERVFTVDWDRDLASGVQISTSAFTITVLRGSDSPALTKDNEALLTAAQATIALERSISGDNRATQVRLKAGTLGTKYKVENEVVTNEAPTQKKNRMFEVLVEDQ